MSTPNEFPGPEQPGSQPSPDGHGFQPTPNAPQNPNPTYQQPPAGYQQPPPGYQQPTYQQPGQQQPAGYQVPPSAGGTKFEMPHDMPHSMNEVMPQGGFSGLFKFNDLPQLLKVSYIIWLVTAGIWLIISVLSFFGSLFLLGAKDTIVFGIPLEGTGAALRNEGIKGLITSIVSLILVAVVLVCIMKLKEGMQWARMALSVIAVLSIILLFFGAGGGLLGVVATVLMWLPESSAWLDARAKGVTS